MTGPVDILLDAALVGSTVSIRFVPTRGARYAAIAASVALFPVAAWTALSSRPQQEFAAIYLAIVFFTGAMKVFRRNRYIAVGLSLMFVSTDLRLFLLHQIPVISGVTLTILLVIVLTPALFFGDEQGRNDR